MGQPLLLYNLCKPEAAVIPMWSSLFTLGLGAGGWWISKFLFEPLKEIYDLRRDVQECLIIHGDLSKDAPEDQRGATATTFFHLGAGLVARDLAAYSWVRLFCVKFLGLDIYSAGGLLIGIGNDTRFSGFSFASLSPTVPLIRKCLRLPAPRVPPMIRAMQVHAGQPGVIEPDDLQHCRHSTHCDNSP